MDSPNSGSMQSSSTAADEDYDSRADPSSSSSISAFLNNNPVPPPQPTTLTAHVPPFQTHVFDPLSNYLDPTQRSHSHPNASQILNLDMMWNTVARSEPDLAGLMPGSSSPSPHNNSSSQGFLLSQLGAGQSQPRGGGATNVAVSAFPTTLASESASARGGFEQNSTNTNTNTNTNVVRNPKKRSRASRRAPTTVLTTDTTNFRAMVQEFTGIPAPPFTSSPFPRTRLDLFASSNASSSALLRSASSHLEQPPSQPQTQTASYLLRPFAHKVQAQPSSIPHTNTFSPMLNTLASNNNSGSGSTSIHYQHHSLNMQNPILSLQSILGNNDSSVLLGSKSQQQRQQPSLEITPGAVDSHLKMGGLEELGLSHAHVGGHHHHHHQNMNLVTSSSDGALSRVNNNITINNNMRGPSSADWAQAQRIGGSNDEGVLRSLSGGTGTGTGTLNYRSSVSDFHGEKGAPDCAVAARSEAIYIYTRKNPGEVSIVWTFVP
ncbi:uncharacterized protein LOC106753440 isoform X1 [Vigna radiata var. radiata]|uniref:Uncharacterized protein LOC106753440 isoform X1 n=1 Tax=Vigna radiata var. radiata TaxID=3916 RepID=A0A3Q0EVW0_VIGRR|nr:uncharacterized protein LOC106753440 isoform X1 [Vigna radiata var. radiata]